MGCVPNFACVSVGGASEMSVGGGWVLGGQGCHGVGRVEEREKYGNSRLGGAVVSAACECASC